ncbi:MAG: hypothetical protein N3A66_03030 [Planctomycetota bacterium]|nr:hypothetical protein [Planctomycetota bacterium]
MGHQCQGPVMPFTPFHLGPAICAKAALARHFSLIAFALAQVAMDLEVAWYLGKWDPPVHRFWHTYVGATAAAAIATILSKISLSVLSRWRERWLLLNPAADGAAATVSWLAAANGAFLGAYSHVLLDALYHSDLEPWQPWSRHNQLHGWCQPATVVIACVLFGFLGLALWLIRCRRRFWPDIFL